MSLVRRHSVGNTHGEVMFAVAMGTIHAVEMDTHYFHYVYGIVQAGSYRYMKEL